MGGGIEDGGENVALDELPAALRGLADGGGEERGLHAAVIAGGDRGRAPARQGRG